MRIMAALAGKLAMKYTRTVSASRELMFPHGNLCIARLSQGRARSILATGAVIILLLSFLLPFLPLPVSANPAFVARAETFATSSAATDLTVDKPDGTANGDILFAFLMWRYATAPQTIDGVPAGWTLLGASNTGNIDEYALYYKIASGEGANYAWSLTGTSKFSIVCSAYTSGDFDPADPIDVVSNTAYRTVDDLADLFEGPKPEDNDMRIDHLVDFTEEDAADILEVDDEDLYGETEGIDDLVSVSREDIMGTRPKPKPKLLLMRTDKPYPPTLAGLR